MLRFWSRRQLSRQSTPPLWRELLHRNVPPYRLLPESLTNVLEKHVRVLLAEKRFEGGGGLQVTEEMRVTIAGNASLLLLGAPWDYYPRLGTVVIYPWSFATPLQATDQTGIVTETIEERLGESWEEGTVILAWDAVQEVIHGTSGDCNVIVHEFAHQLDAQRGLTDGPRLLTANHPYRNWQALLTHEQQHLRTGKRRGRPAILDPYALTSATELFAVATETFFMRPVRLQANHPELYAELQTVFSVNPVNWLLGIGC